MSAYLNIFFICLFSVLLLSNSNLLIDLLITNAFLQVLLFSLVAVFPYLRNHRMSYVDIAWPFGVALIGAQILVLSPELNTLTIIVACFYLFIGLRMGIAAVIMGKKTGVIFKHEFPRYEFSLYVLKKRGSKNIVAHRLSEIMAQGFANITALALPGFLVATSDNSGIGYIEVVGMTIWIIGYVLESVADGQKLSFISKNPKGLCNVGLWRYSRHPNYFGEWLVWTGLVVLAMPSWLTFQATESLAIWLFMGFGAICASIMLYVTLVYLTGAIPAEYYSLKKRPAYKEYQQTTNRFFPWFPKS